MAILHQSVREHEMQPFYLDRTNRAPLVKIIAQALLSQYCIEEGVKLVNLTDLSPTEAKPYFEMAEFSANYVLSPDRRQAAIAAMADVICADGTERGLFEYPSTVVKHYLALSVSAINALNLNLKEVPPDAAYRENLSRLVDGLMPERA